MRIWLLQRNEPTPHDEDGSERLLRTGIMAQVFVNLGHSVVWWTSDFDHYKRRHRHGGNYRARVNDLYEIQYLKARSYKRNISLSRVVSNIEVGRSFSRVVVGGMDRPDVIIASIPTVELAWAAIKYAKEFDVPIFVDVRDLWPDHIIELAPKWSHPVLSLTLSPLSHLTKKVFSHANGIFGITEAMMQWGLSYAGRHRQCGDKVIPMGYTLPRLDTNKEGEYFWDQLGIKQQKNQMVIVFLGTIGRGFDFEPVLDAARSLLGSCIQFKFIICGDGEFMQQVRVSAENISNVFVPGWMNQAQIIALLSRSDVGLLPYKDLTPFKRSIPNKPAEYLASGLVLASSLSDGVLSEFIKDNDCGFTYGGTSNELASRLEELGRNDGQLEAKKIAAAEAFKRNLDGEMVYSELAVFLEEFLAVS